MEREKREILVPDSYTGHGLETFLAGGQGGGAGPEVDQVLPLQRAHLLDHAPQPPLERHQPEAWNMILEERVHTGEMIEEDKRIKYTIYNNI